MEGVIREALGMGREGPERGAERTVGGMEIDAILRELTAESRPGDLDVDDLPFGDDVGTANIVIVGVGGAGCNTVDSIMRIGVKGATCVAINTDKRHLKRVKAHKKVLIGASITGGLGAGGFPEVGRACAERDAHLIAEALGKRPDLVFITAGMGGGTGTGAAPVVARIAREKGAMVIAVATMPFKSEGKKRMQNAIMGIRRLRKYADTVIMMANDKLLTFGDLTIQEAFLVGDYVLAIMVKGITEIINNKNARVNVDFADIKALMALSGGISAVGIGEASDGDNRVLKALEKALENKLLDFDLSGKVKGAIMVVIGGKSLKLREVTEAVSAIHSKLVEDGMFKWGMEIDESMGDTVRVILLLSGVKSPYILNGEESSRRAPRSGMLRFVGTETLATDAGEEVSEITNMVLTLMEGNIMMFT